jgi:hypothetical protein
MSNVAEPKGPEEKSKKRKIPLWIIIVVGVVLVACCGISGIIGLFSTTGDKIQATTTPPDVAAATTVATEPPDMPAPTATSAPTNTPPPTTTPKPMYSEPTVLLELDGVGETVTDNFKFPECQKAVFYWTAMPGQYGSASLIVHLHNVATGKEMTLVNEFAMDTPEGISGSALQPLAGGEYYFTTENTDEAWTLRVECQDNQAPVGSELDLQGIGNIVTDNYELPACSKSVFAWSVEPNDSGTASLIVYLCKVGETRCPSLVNEFDMDLTAPLKGEALQKLSGGIYFLATDNTSGRPWTIRWECQD